jgi:chromosomal replication initiation ATPase DnaA
MPRFRPAARSLDPSLDRQGKANRDRLRAAFVTSLVAMTTGVCPAQIQSRTRNKAEAARARQIAMYLSHVSFEWPLARVGAAFGRDRTTASHACHKVEDLRDDADFDANLNAMEACLRNAPLEGPDPWNR